MIHPEQVAQILNHAIIAERYFFPQRATVIDPVRIPIDCGELHCWRSAAPSNKPVLLHFHGNGELIQHWIPGFVPLLQTFGFEVFLAEYRGYGSSSGQPQLLSLLHDVPNIVKAVGVAPEKLVVFGRSVGSIFAIEAAHQFPNIAGLIIESGISDVYQRLRLRMQPEELGCNEEQFQQAVKLHFDHHHKLQQYTNPLLLLHAIHDQLVTIAHAEHNLASAGSVQKKLIRFPQGNHNSIMSANQGTYFHHLHRFLQTLPLNA